MSAKLLDNTPVERDPKKPRIDKGASAASRWCLCTRSPSYVFENWHRIPPQDTTFSKEGNTAHAVAEAEVTGLPIDPKKCPIPTTPEMFSHAWDYAEYIDSLKGPGAEVLVEQKFELWYAKGRNCFIDCAVLNKGDNHVIDYKYGAGVAVSPVENKQMVVYAYSTGKKLFEYIAGSTPFALHIYQPRCQQQEQAASVWETNWGTICELAAEIEEKSKECDDPDLAVFAPSDKACQFCPAKGFCTARQASLADGLEPLTLQPNNRPGGFPPATALTEEQQAKVVQYAPSIRSWLKGVEDHVRQSMCAGTTYPGLKLVTGRDGNRKWSDEAAAAQALRTMGHKDDTIFEPRTLLGPAPIEKLVGKKRFKDNLSDLISRAPGQPKVVVDSDERESVYDGLKGDFEALDAAINAEVIDVTSEFESF